MRGEIRSESHKFSQMKPKTITPPPTASETDAIQLVRHTWTNPTELNHR